MGKKSKIFYFSVLFVNIVFFILDWLPLNLPFAFFRISFPVSLILIGILLINRSIIYKLDSSMFFGVTLLLTSTIDLIEKLSKSITSWDVWPYYIVSIAIASLITAICYKDKLQIKLFALFLGFGLLSILFTTGVLVLWLYITLMIVWFVAYFIFNIVKAKRRK